MDLSTALWADLKTDADRARWLLLGRGYETGVVAHAVQADLAMAYHRLALLTNTSGVMAVDPLQDLGPLGYAARLAEAIWRKHYQQDAPEWRPLPTLAGVLTQIDNMVAGLTKPRPAGVDSSGGTKA